MRRSGSLKVWLSIAVVGTAGASGLAFGPSARASSPDAGLNISATRWREPGATVFRRPTGVVSPGFAARLWDSASPASAALVEDFEGPWPGLWSLQDLSELDGGDYLWGRDGCTPHDGVQSGRAAAGGAAGSRRGCSSAYPSESYTWMTHGPFSLRDARSAELTFHVRGRTEGAVGGVCSYDYLMVGHSVDDNRYGGVRVCGNWTDGPDRGGFYRESVDLSSRLGEGRVWIAFAFRSDASVSYEGMTVDDIRLEIDESSATTSPPSATATRLPPTVTRAATGEPTPTAPTPAAPTPAGPAATPPLGATSSPQPAWMPYLSRAAVINTSSPTPTPTNTPTPTMTPTATRTPRPCPANLGTGAWAGSNAYASMSFTVDKDRRGVKDLSLRASTQCGGGQGQLASAPIDNCGLFVRAPGGGVTMIGYGTFDNATTMTALVGVQNGGCTSFWYLTVTKR